MNGEKKSERTPRGGWKTAISDITGSLKIIKVILPKDENRSKAACCQEGHYPLACLKVDSFNQHKSFKAQY